MRMGRLWAVDPKCPSALRLPSFTARESFSISTTWSTQVEQAGLWSAHSILTIRAKCWLTLTTPPDVNKSLFWRLFLSHRRSHYWFSVWSVSLAWVEGARG